MFDKSTSEVKELRFQVLNAMLDDAEDIEPIYLTMRSDLW